MAGKFVDLKDAAKILGVTSEELVELRSQGEIFGYRDGASWKFKIEEVERVASERSAAGRSGSGVLSGDDDFDDIMAGDSAAGKSGASGLDDGADSVLVSDDPAGSALGRQSTVIGKDLRGKRPEDSDLKLGDSSLANEGPQGSISGTAIGPPKAGPAKGESYDLASESTLGLAESDIKRGSGKGSKKGPGSSGLSSSGMGSSGPGSDVLGDIQLSTAGSGGTGALKDSDSAELDLGGSGAYSLEESAIDDEISLEGAPGSKKGHGSDVTYSPGDSGINLRSPSDSGLSLDEEPLDLGSGSGVDQLELPEDDDVIALEDEVDPDLATQLRADEAFSLSPASLDGGGEEESDSGSQVIALEDSSAFDQNAATMLNQGAPLMAEGAFTEVAMPGFEPGMMPGTMAGAQPYVVTAPVETPYSVWNVLGLMVTAGTLAVAGMLMWDVMLNLWSYDQAGTVSTSLMDSIVSGAGLNK